MEMQGNSLTLRQARALIRHRVRNRLAKYRAQDIWNTWFFIDRLDLAVEAFDCQAAKKPDGAVAEVDELIETVREEFLDFVLLEEDTRERVKFLDREHKVACEACSQIYNPFDYAKCPSCNHPNLYQITESELDSLVEQLKLEADDPIAKRALAETESWRMETCYQKTVTCFETFHKKLNELAFVETGKPSVKLSRRNLFQNVQEAWKWFQKHHNLDLSRGLSPREIESLELVINKRHVITHNGGIIDRDYVQTTSENPQKIGQPVSLRKHEILEAIGLVYRVIQTARVAFS